MGCFIIDYPEVLKIKNTFFRRRKMKKGIGFIILFLLILFHPIVSLSEYKNAKEKTDKRKFKAYGKIGITAIFGIVVSVLFVPNLWCKTLFSALCFITYYMAGYKQSELIEIIAREEAISHRDYK